VLNFQTSDSFPNQIYLIDHYLETETHITESDPTYYFNVEQSISGSFDENRFSLKLIPSSLSTSNPLLQQTKLYPNPTRGAFSINGLTDLRNSEVKIFNLMGQEVYALKLKSTSEVRITDFNASAGVYLVKLSSDQGERVFKLVKHH
jgi:hypothetical protein